MAAATCFQWKRKNQPSNPPFYLQCNPQGLKRHREKLITERRTSRHGQTQKERTRKGDRKAEETEKKEEKATREGPFAASQSRLLTDRLELICVSSMLCLDALV